MNPENQRKTYFWTNQFETKFPEQFKNSINKKWIVVEECKAQYKGALAGDVILHADFICRDPYLDYACCFINEEANRDTAKYEYTGDRETFKLWFTDLKGVNVNEHIDAFDLRLLLIY